MFYQSGHDFLGLFWSQNLRIHSFAYVIFQGLHEAPKSSVQSIGASDLRGVRLDWKIQVGREQKTQPAILSIEYWLFNRDPSSGWTKNNHITG